MKDKKQKKTFKQKTGTKRKVWNGTAEMTSGRLTKNDLVKNKRGRIVSKKKSKFSKKNNNLKKAGFFTKKGKFGYVKKTKKLSKNKYK